MPSVTLTLLIESEGTAPTVAVLLALILLPPTSLIEVVIVNVPVAA